MTPLPSGATIGWRYGRPSTGACSTSRGVPGSPARSMANPSGPAGLTTRPSAVAVPAGPEVVVVTGASAGVGRATAQAFARRGARVGLLARGRAGLEGARREVEELGGKALAVPTDVSDAEAVERAAEAVERELG